MVNRSYRQLFRLLSALCLSVPLVVSAAVIDVGWQAHTNQGQLVIDDHAMDTDMAVVTLPQSSNPLDLLSDQDGSGPVTLTDKSITPPLFGQGALYSSHWAADFLNFNIDDSDSPGVILVLVKIGGIFIAIGLLLLIRRLWVLRKLKARYMDRIISN